MHCLTWTEYRLSVLCRPAAAVRQIFQAEPATVIRCSPRYTYANCECLPTCDEEAIAERCPCLRLDAYPTLAAGSLPSFLHEPLEHGETRFAGALTAAAR
jgi:hypothetical protein